MSLQIVRKIRAKYPTPLGSQHAAFLVELARAIPGAGLLKKTSGTRIKLPKPWNVEVSQDIICFYDPKTDTATHYDVLKDGEGEAKPTWNLIGPIDGLRYVDVSAGPAPTPTPPAPPSPGDSLAKCLADLRVIVARLEAL
jgi:hypothetical protein